MYRARTGANQKDRPNAVLNECERWRREVLFGRVAGTDGTSSEGSWKFRAASRSPVAGGTYSVVRCRRGTARRGTAVAFLL